MLVHVPVMHDWQLGETESWVLGLVDNVSGVLYRTFLNIREVGVKWENKTNHFFQRVMGNFKRQVLYSVWECPLGRGPFGFPINVLSSCLRLFLITQYFTSLFYCFFFFKLRK